MINRNHIAGAPVCSFVFFHPFFFFTVVLMILLVFAHHKQRLVLIALLTGTALPTSKTLADALREGLVHPGDPILLDTDDILSE